MGRPIVLPLALHPRDLYLWILIFASFCHCLRSTGAETKRDEPKLETLKEFAPPGNLSDLNAASRKTWSEDFVSSYIDHDIALLPKNHTQFFNGRETPYDTSQPGVVATWIGFPNLVEVNPKYSTVKAKLKAAEKDKYKQDEYLEWSVLKQDNNIHRVVFTCEGPEYWYYYFKTQRDDAIKTVRAMNAPYLDDVPKDAFFKVDPSDPKNESLWEYNGDNQYNNDTSTGTVTHLMNGVNSLFAEIDLASAATIIRKNKKHNPITDEHELICCSGFGLANRNSDPRIGSAINSLARSNRSVSIADPVGLYMQSLDLSGLKLDTTGDQSHLTDIPAGTFKFTRGDISKGQGLRLQIEVPKGVESPDGKQLFVSDIYDTNANQYIAFGAQIAKRVTMGVKGVAIAGVQAAPAKACVSSCDKTSKKAEEKHGRISGRFSR